MTADKNNRFCQNQNREYWSRCILCRLPVKWCICSLAPKLETKTKLTLLVHQMEWRKASNTGHMIRNAFASQRILIQGRPHVLLCDEDIYWNDHPAYILHPGRGGLTLDQIPVSEQEQGIHLIVPDGNWRQSSSMLKRIRPLGTARTVMLSTPAPERRRQRINTSPERMSTLEAIITAVHQLEGHSSGGSNEILNRLMGFYQMYADCMLMMRGKMRISETTLPFHANQ